MRVFLVTPKNKKSQPAKEYHLILDSMLMFQPKTWPNNMRRTTPNNKHHLVTLTLYHYQKWCFIFLVKIWSYNDQTCIKMCLTVNAVNSFPSSPNYYETTFHPSSHPSQLLLVTKLFGCLKHFVFSKVFKSLSVFDGFFFSVFHLRFSFFFCFINRKFMVFVF